MPIQKMCKGCGRSILAYNTLQNLCAACLKKKGSSLKQKGSKTLRYEKWRDLIAIPYLEKRYGRVCSHKGCTETENLDVDHIKKRGSHADQVFDVKNCRFLCRKHHQEATDKLHWSKKDGILPN